MPPPVVGDDGKPFAVFLNMLDHRSSMSIEIGGLVAENLQ
jgi:hypothetical protein